MSDQVIFRCCFEIAGITIALNTERPIDISGRFLPFLREGIFRCDYEAFFHQVDELPEFPDVCLQREDAYDVGRMEDNCYCRRFRDLRYDRKIYAFSYFDWEKRHIEVEYLSLGEHNLNQTDNCFFHIAWETILQLEDRMILHACGIDTSFGGILFSGISGIGKSTQGNLWCRYEGASLVNGDRPFINKEGNIWYAYGAPYAGSSKCHVDKRTPIRAIVMLKQGEMCKIRRLNPAEAFRRVYAGMTVSTWNSECVAKTCDIAESLIGDIPVYELECTPDQRAVDLLKKTLLEDEL